MVKGGREREGGTAAATSFATRTCAVPFRRTSIISPPGGHKMKQRRNREARFSTLTHSPYVTKTPSHNGLTGGNRVMDDFCQIWVQNEAQISGDLRSHS